MAWIKVDVRTATDPRLLSVGLAGKGLWLEGMCYAGMHQTDGHVPSCAVSDPHLADKLIKAGLWAKTPAGYEVLDFLVLNHTREQIAQARAEKKERMATLRAERSQNVRSVTSNGRVTNTLDRRSQIVDNRSQIVDGRSTDTTPEVLAHLQRVLKAGV